MIFDQVRSLRPGTQVERPARNLGMVLLKTA